MSLKLKWPSNWNVTQMGMPFTFEFHLNWNVTQIGISLKLECHWNLNVTQIGTTLNWNATQIEMPLHLITLRLKCHSSWNVILAWRKGQDQTCQHPGPSPKRRLSLCEGCQSLWWRGLAQYWPKLTGASWLAF